MSEKNDKEIQEIKTEFGAFKKDVSSKLDKLFAEVKKPIFTEKEKATIIISLAVYLIFTVNYINGNNYRSVKNENSIEKINLRNDKIYDILITIKEDVATIKGKDKNNN